MEKTCHAMQKHLSELNEHASICVILLDAARLRECAEVRADDCSAMAVLHCVLTLFFLPFFIDMKNKITSVERTIDSMYEESYLRQHRYTLHAVLVHQGQALAGIEPFPFGVNLLKKVCCLRSALPLGSVSLTSDCCFLQHQITSDLYSTFQFHII